MKFNKWLPLPGFNKDPVTKSQKPPAKIIMPWPDGANTVYIYMWETIGEFKKGERYVLSREAFLNKAEPMYMATGTRVSWTESSLKELVIQGKIAVLPDQNKKSGSS